MLQPQSRKNIDKESLRAGFEGCKQDEKLRFAVGDNVEVQTKEGWKDAKVIGLLDQFFLKPFFPILS